MILIGESCSKCGGHVLDNGTSCSQCGTPYSARQLTIGKAHHEAVSAMITHDEMHGSRLLQAEMAMVKDKLRAMAAQTTFAPKKGGPVLVRRYPTFLKWLFDVRY